ncbi:hypothetical protein ACLOJK_000254 [Asimina triloba]
MPHPIKITKKHHKRFNNPFPSRPKSLALASGNLFSSTQTLPNPHQNFPIGHDFQLHHTHQNGGFVSISHNSQPHRSIWSTVPGQAFVSAACAETEAEESRGSFVIKDNDVLCICNHQFIEEILVLDQPQIDFSSGSLALDPTTAILDQFKGTHFPALVITGCIFNRKKLLKSISGKSVELETRKLKFGKVKKLFISAKYSVLFYQQNQHQVGFRVEFGKPNLELPHGRDWASASKSFRSLRWRLGQKQKRQIAWFQVRHRFKKLSSEEDEEEEKEEEISEAKGFNRIFITYTSQEDERFYGFGEQFSHMEFKGKRVPIFVQEQGIGRGDQPITLAANLVSYSSSENMSGGDSSTTYAPSPFYMTSKMRSLYLEGYSYSVFDLTKLDRVQIQIYDGCAQGRILHGNTPVELIERFTETIGRPPELPKWIISGAVVGMQGGTEAVCHVWDHLREYKVPIAAFWLQLLKSTESFLLNVSKRSRVDPTTHGARMIKVKDWVGQRKTIIGSQLWWNWEVDIEQYPGWTQLVEDLRSHNIKIMAYCNPCLAPGVYPIIKASISFQTDDKPNRKRNLFQEANNLGIFVKDEAGDTYMVPNTAFDVGMLDFTHPATCVWFKKILHDMVNSGVRGWMADFGEGLPLDACLFSGL